MSEQNTIYLTEEDLILTNTMLIKKLTPGERIGVKEPSLLNSAVNRPRQSAFREDAYKSIFEKAAALYQSVAQNHAFFNANKRTAFVSLVTFLRRNGVDFKTTSKDAVEFTVLISDQENHISFAEITNWIRKNSIKINENH